MPRGGPGWEEMGVEGEEGGGVTWEKKSEE